MKVLISGSSGFIGSALVTFLTHKGHEVFKLVRKQAKYSPNEIAWDIERGEIDTQALEGIEAVIHLAGENIATGRWTEAKKKKILDSRVLGTRLLCQALASLKHPPQVLVSASAIGYYGSRGKELLTEESSSGIGFLTQVCQEWESATQVATDKGIRVGLLRMGVILSTEGGALKAMLPPFNWGLGAIIGTGDQYMSWITLDDLLKVINEILHNHSLEGPINAVSPNPITNRDFTKTLGQILHRPIWLRVPDFMIRLALGEMADEMLLSSSRVEPKKLLDQQFKFDYPSIENALKHVLNSPKI